MIFMEDIQNISLFVGVDFSTNDFRNFWDIFGISFEKRGRSHHSAPFHRNIGDKMIAANIYENLSSIFLNRSLPYTKLPVGL